VGLARQLARAACAEMHGGFRNLRAAMPMNIRASYPGKGVNAEVQRDIDRICVLWQTCREQREGAGDMLFGAFGAVDAYFAPAVMRFMTYAVALPEAALRYCGWTVRAPRLSSCRPMNPMRDWCNQGSHWRRTTAAFA